MKNISIRLLLLLCVGIWGATFIATKVCLAYLSPYELVGMRFLIGLPILAIIIAGQKLSWSLSRPEQRTVAIGAAVMAVHFVLQAMALERTSAINTGWIIAVAPLAVVLLSYFFLKEELSRRELFGMAVASGGVLLLISKGDLGSLSWLRSPGDWMVLASAFTWAIYTVLTRDLSRARSPLVITFYVFLPVALVCSASMAFASRLGALAALGWRPWLALLFLGVLGTAAQWFWQVGVSRLGASKAGLFLYLEPLATTALAIPLLGESFGMATAMGGALVLAGVWWAGR